MQHSQTARLLGTVSVSDNGALNLRGFHPLGRIFLDLLSPTAKALQTVLCTTIPRFQVPSTADSSIGCSLFTRRYLGNHSCFLFLRLMICLSSARSPALQWCLFKKKYQRAKKLIFGSLIFGAHVRRILLLGSQNTKGDRNHPWVLVPRDRKQLAGTIPTAWTLLVPH